MTLIRTMTALWLIGFLAGASAGAPRMLAGAGEQTAVSRAIETCVSFSSNGRLSHGRSFTTQLPRGLELRLLPEGDFGWSITVRRSGGAFDYLWIVSPPFQTAPHRQIGPVYGVSARESVGIPRELHFVLTDDGYEQARMIVESKSDASRTIAALDRLTKGRLTIEVVKFGTRPSASGAPSHEALDWIEFKGEACAPK